MSKNNMNYTLECLEKFEELSPEIKEVFGGNKAYSLIEDLESQYEIDLAFILILLAIDELRIPDLPEYLKKKYKFSPEKSNLIINEIEKQIIEPANKIIEETEGEVQIKKSDIHELIFSVFSENLLLVFSYSKEEIKSFNIAIFAAFNENDILEERVIEAFYKNKELISNETINVEEKEKPASIENFLKDFIKINGSDMPDNLVLANYLNTSKNVKKLSENEKNILNRVLKTYKNLVFFPESMEGVPMEFWEVIPVKDVTGEVFDVLDDKKNTNFDKDLKLKIKESQEKRIKDLSEEKTKKQQKTKKQELKQIKESSISELQKMIDDYPKGSLGYKAIKQEIDRLKKNKKN